MKLLQRQLPVFQRLVLMHEVESTVETLFHLEGLRSTPLPTLRNQIVLPRKLDRVISLDRSRMNDGAELVGGANLNLRGDPHPALFRQPQLLAVTWRGTDRGEAILVQRIGLAEHLLRPPAFPVGQQDDILGQFCDDILLRVWLKHCPTPRPREELRPWRYGLDAAVHDCNQLGNNIRRVPVDAASTGEGFPVATDITFQVFGVV